jgi:hypothetical protein
LASIRPTDVHRTKKHDPAHQESKKEELRIRKAKSEPSELDEETLSDACEPRLNQWSAKAKKSLPQPILFRYEARDTR